MNNIRALRKLHGLTQADLADILEVKPPAVNIYKTARKKRGITQEMAAEAMGISTDSISRYETGTLLPPDDVVFLMTLVYDSQHLAVQHLHQSSALASQVVPYIDSVTLQTATIRLVNRMVAFMANHRDCQLMTIAEDGVVSNEERPLYEAILADLEGIVKSSYELKSVRGIGQP